MWNFCPVTPNHTVVLITELPPLKAAAKSPGKHFTCSKQIISPPGSPYSSLYTIKKANLFQSRQQPCELNSMVRKKGVQCSGDSPLKSSMVHLLKRVYSFLTTVHTQLKYFKSLHIKNILVRKCLDSPYSAEYKILLSVFKAQNLHLPRHDTEFAPWWMLNKLQN